MRVKYAMSGVDFEIWSRAATERRHLKHSLLFIVIKINPTKIINECDHRVLSHWKDSGICLAAVGGLIILAVIQGVVCRRFLGVERGVRRRRGGHRGVRKGVLRV